MSGSVVNMEQSKNMTPKTERFELRLDLNTITEVDHWRKKQNNLPSRSEAIRCLIETGLGTSSRQDFLAMKFQILVASLVPYVKESLSDAHVFAWQHEIYPFENKDWAEPFATHFLVTKQMMVELSEYLDGLWLKKKTTTFYELEDYYELSRGTTPWDRVKLIDACRYMRLQGLFGDDFWDEVVRESPREATSILSIFNREDIHFG